MCTYIMHKPISALVKALMVFLMLQWEVPVVSFVHVSINGFCASWPGLTDFPIKSPLRHMSTVPTVVTVCCVVCSPTSCLVYGTLKLKVDRVALACMNRDKAWYYLLLATPKEWRALSQFIGWLASPMLSGCDVVLFRWNTATVCMFCLCSAWYTCMDRVVSPCLPACLKVSSSVSLGSHRLTTRLLLPPSQQGLCHFREKQHLRLACSICPNVFYCCLSLFIYSICIWHLWHSF